MWHRNHLQPSFIGGLIIYGGIRHFHASSEALFFVLLSLSLRFTPRKFSGEKNLSSFSSFIGPASYAGFLLSLPVG